VGGTFQQVERRSARGAAGAAPLPRGLWGHRGPGRPFGPGPAESGGFPTILPPLSGDRRCPANSTGRGRSYPSRRSLATGNLPPAPEGFRPDLDSLLTAALLASGRTPAALLWQGLLGPGARLLWNLALVARIRLALEAQRPSLERELGYLGGVLKDLRTF
jgi:hypothetical protein